MLLEDASFLKVQQLLVIHNKFYLVEFKTMDCHESRSI